MDKLDRSLDSIIGSSRHGPSRNSYGGQSRKIWRLCLSCSGGSRRNGRRENRQAKPYTRAAERGGRTAINTSSGEQSEHKVRSPGDAVPVARQPIDLPYPAQVSGQTPPKMLAGLIAARVRLAACLAAGGALSVPGWFFGSLKAREHHFPELACVGAAAANQAVKAIVPPHALLLLLRVMALAMHACRTATCRADATCPRFGRPCASRANTSRTTGSTSAFPRRL